MNKKSIFCVFFSMLAFVLAALALGVPVLTANGKSVSIGDNISGQQELVSLLNALWAFTILLLVSLVVCWGLHFYNKTLCDIMGIVTLVFAIITLSLSCAVIAKINQLRFTFGSSAPLIFFASLLVIIKQLLTNNIITSMY
jgi:hypothetical protein